MRKLTQTVTASAANGWAGNCWQTCVAIILGVDPEELPAQAECDLCTTTPDGKRGDFVKGTPSYQSRLRAYLREHHGLAYVQLHHSPEVFECIRVADDRLYFMSGTTVRSAAYGGMRHVVVAQNGAMVWDPHPSRAGLLGDIEWAFLVTYPKWWRESDARRLATGHALDPCVCPKCKATAGAPA